MRTFLSICLQLKIAKKIEPIKVHDAIQKMKKKAASIQNDLTMKLIVDFSVELAFDRCSLSQHLES